MNAFLRWCDLGDFGPKVYGSSELLELSGFLVVGLPRGRHIWGLGGNFFGVCPLEGLGAAELFEGRPNDFSGGFGRLGIAYSIIELPWSHEPIQKYKAGFMSAIGQRKLGR